MDIVLGLVIGVGIGLAAVVVFALVLIGAWMAGGSH